MTARNHVSFFGSATHALVLLLACGAIACSSAQKPQAMTAPREHGGQVARVALSAPSPAAGVGGACPRDASVYFAFDSSALDPSARGELADLAACVQRQTPSHVGVTGMADPRGTEEYNMALGDRRAVAVSNYLGSLGVDQSRLSPRSVGEEYATGQDEDGWARDRRAQVTAP